MSSLQGSDDEKPTLGDGGEQARQPDELDELLKRTESAQNGLQELNQNYQTHTYDIKTPFHRKSVSIGVDAFMRGGGPRRRPPRHRKNMSSVTELLAFASGDMAPIREDFQETAENLRIQFVDGLGKMKTGESYNFDMSLTRSLSVLPDNVLELGHEAGMEEMGKEGRSAVFQYITLLSAVAGISSNSTALHMLDGVAPLMKLFWRMSASYLVLSPMAVHYLMSDGMPDLSLGGWMTFIAAILCFTVQNCLFYSALELTTIGNAVIYANSQALLLIVGKACIGQPIHQLEAFGVVIAFSGAIMCSKDSESNSENDGQPNAIYGDLMALASAVAGVAYLTFAKAVRSEMSVTVFIFYVMFFGSLSLLAYMAMSPVEDLVWDANPMDGIFGGFGTYHGRIFVLLYLAVICNCIGTMGFVRSMEYFDTVIIAVATLMEPLLASLIAFAFHAGLLPGPLGWVGNALVVLGTLTVVYPSMGKKDVQMH